MEKNRTIDGTDLKILKILQEKARIPNAEVARQVGMAPSAILERIRKLETQGIIEGYEVRVNPRCVGRGLIAFVRLQTEGWESGEVVGHLREHPAVQEIHQVAGNDGYMVKVRVADTEALGKLLREEFQSLAGVHQMHTDVVLSTFKETPGVPLDSLEESVGENHS